MGVWGERQRGGCDPILTISRSPLYLSQNKKQQKPNFINNKTIAYAYLKQIVK